METSEPLTGSLDDVGAGPQTSSAPIRPRTPNTLEKLLSEKEALASRLTKQLQHYRSWVASVHVRVQHMNPKAVQNAKRLYVGNLPQNATEEELCAFLNELMEQTGAQVGSEPAVLQCHITAERNFAFAEFRSVEEASSAMGLDGVAWKDTYLKIRRPSNYDLATSLLLGPITPDPTMDLSCVQLSKPLPEESPNKLFVGGLPCEWPEQAVRLLLEPWGAIKAFNLVMDKTTGNSKGYAFCEFVDESVTDSAIAGLNGQRAGSKTLTVKRAAEGARQGGVNSSLNPQASSTGISPNPTPSQPSSFDDPSTGSGRGAAGNPLSPTYNPSYGGNSGGFGRKNSGAQGSGGYMMGGQGMGMMMPSRPVGGNQGNYGAMTMPRPIAGSMDSHMAHMSPMQPHLMQPYMAQPMHVSPGGFGAVMMTPTPVMIQSPTSGYGSMDQFGPMGGSGQGNRTHNKPQRQHSGQAGGANPSNWVNQVMQTGLIAPTRPQNSHNQDSKAHE